MKLMAKKLLSFLLVFSMLLGLSVPAFAVETSATIAQLHLDASDVALTKSASAQQATITFFIKEDVELGAYQIKYALDGTPDGVTLGEATSPVANMTNAYASGFASAYATSQAGVASYDSTVDGYVIFTLPVTVAAEKTGTFNVNFTVDYVTDYVLENDYTLASNTVTATITVEAPAAQGYTAGLNTTTPTVTVGGTATVNVGVSHSSDSAFNAAELVLAYDSSFLSVESVTNSINATEELKYEDDAANGVLTIQDFGADKSFNTANYVITFTTKGVTAANTPATATVTLTYAKFIDKVGATTSDLIDATLSTASVDVTITEETFDVTLPTDGVITGDTEAVKGADYTFTVAEPGNYAYDITVTVGGNEIDTFVDNGNGTYTIPGASVIDDIEITYTREANTYSVTWGGNAEGEVTNKPEPDDEATYGTPFTFTLPADVEPGLEPGWTYAATVTIGGNTYGCSVDGLNYTIAGADITGAIVITVTKTEVDENQYTVSATGTGAGDAATSSPVNKNGTATLTLTPEAGYEYEVTATMGGQAVSALIGGNTYTVADVTGNVVFTVTKTLNTFNTNVYDYVNGMKLVTFAPTLASGKVPTYGGNVMFYSAKYQAYCYLVLAQDLSVADAQAQLGAVTGTATDVDYGMNINGSAHIDAADAQLVWNMYNARYTDFNSGVTMAQFLAADQNALSTDATASYGLSVQDALVIIEALLAGTAQ